jgi:HSP20 family molecular chaperone IbpA
MWAEACALLDRAEQLHRQFFEPAGEAGRHARWEPPIDVFETELQLRIIVALPGVAPEAVQVQTEGGILSIVGNRPLPSCGENTKIVRLEIPYGIFERRIALQLNRLRLDQRELVNGCLVLTFVKLG